MQMISVSSLNEKIKSLLETTFMHIRVEGEIASVTYHNSGHVYFSIKDERSTLRCVMWRSNAAKLKFKLEKGEHIVVDGSISVYVPRGEYQMLAVHAEPYGKGALALAFEQLKKKLESKGYFDKRRKKPIPEFPEKIAIVTAAGGAALQDMLKVARKRWPLTEIVVIDVLVQGEGAAGEIAEGIREADRLGADVIVAGRGGGSTEDLWAFNEEAVADAIYEARTPVVSAVGHEVDVLLSDFTADMRAPTPSAAMEQILPDRNEMLYLLDESMDRIKKRVLHLIQMSEERARREGDALRGASISAQLKRTADRFASLEHDYREIVRYSLMQFENTIAPLKTRATEIMGHALERKKNSLQLIEEKFRLSDPRLVKREGWAEISVKGRKIPLNALDKGDIFNLTDGKVRVEAECLGKQPLK